MGDNKSSYLTLLERIRERPGIYLGKRSLTALWHFKDGYFIGESAGRWEMSTKRNFFENSEEAFFSPMVSEKPAPYNPHEFNEFVHAHYNKSVNGSCAEHLILEMTDSEEEAFDKYFEFLDAFLKKQKS